MANTRPPGRPHGPALTQEICADEERLSAAIEIRLKREPAMRHHRRRIVGRQKRLRALSTQEAWKAYLVVEEAVNHRFGDALIAVARWAFAQGRKCRGRS